MLLQIYCSLILCLLSGNTSSKPVMKVLYICRWWCEYKLCYRGQPYMNDVASGVPVVGPHVHVQQGLFVEASGKCSQCVLKTPRLLWDEKEIHSHLKLACSCKVSFNVVHHGIQAPALFLLDPWPLTCSESACTNTVCKSIRNQPVCTTKFN